MRKLIYLIVVFFIALDSGLIAQNDARREKLFKSAEKEIAKLLAREDQVASRRIALSVATYILYLTDSEKMDKRFEQLFIEAQIASDRNGHAQVDMLISPNFRKQAMLERWIKIKTDGGGVAYREITLMDFIADVYETMDSSDYKAEIFALLDLVIFWVEAGILTG